ISDEGKQTKKAFDDLPDIVVDFHKIREDNRRLDKLQGLHNVLNSITDQIAKLPTIQVDVNIDFGKIRKNIQKLTKIQKFHEILDLIESKITALGIIKLDPSIEKAQNEWTIALAELKICPVCKQSTVNIETHCGQP
ncbi:hypothetical protein LCGC14_2074230, partial [marine sediment metagenome]